MMSQPIFDMHAVAAQEFVTDDASQGLFDKLLDGIVHLPDASAQEVADEVLERAAGYAGSQPSFAEDLRAAAGEEALA